MDGAMLVESLKKGVGRSISYRESSLEFMDNDQPGAETGFQLNEAPAAGTLI